MADTVILGPDGKPVSSLNYAYAGPGGGSTGRRFIDGASYGDGDRPSWPVRLDSINRLLPAYEWRILVAISEKIVANMDVVKGALWSKAMYTVGRAWLPRFEGEARDWGKLAQEWLVERYYPMCDLRGPMHDFQTTLQMDSVAVDRGGDFGILLTEYASGFPAVQRVPNWRIGELGGGQQQVDSVFTNKNPDGSPFGDGVSNAPLSLAAPLQNNNGVLMNAMGRPLYYRIRVDEGDTSWGQSIAYIDVHASDFIHVYDPEYYEQSRGIPALAASVNKLRDALQSHEWEQLAMLAHSSIVFTEDNETGGPDPSDPRSLAMMASPSDAGASGLQSQQLMGGLVKYFKANSGGKLNSFSSLRPGDSWEKIMDRIIASAMRGINWSPMLAAGRDNPGGQLARADIDQCNKGVTDRQDLLRYPARRMVGRAVCKAIKIGDLPPYPGKDMGGMLKWGFTLPGEISIDDGRDRANDRADYVLGLENEDDILARRGHGSVEDHLYRRARIAGRRKQIQAEVSAEMGVEIGDNDMQLLAPNGNPPDPSVAQSGDDEPPTFPPDPSTDGQSNTQT